MIKIKSVDIENFKGIRQLHIDFGQKTNISGANAVGKSSIFDAVTWLLWNKDSSGSEKFHIRPIDENGENIHFIDISVVAVLEIDDVEYELKKVQKEKWVKKRGTESQEFQGNVNEFEINGYPKSQKDYSEFISSIINEDKFKLISNPVAFTSLPWKEQRKILFSIVNEVSDYDISQTDSRFIDLSAELKIASIDDIKAKYLKTMNGLKKQQTELPARIDEVSKQILDIDVSDLELQRNVLKEQIESLEKEKSENNTREIVNRKMDEAFNLKLKASEIERNAYAEIDEKIKNVQSDIYRYEEKKNSITYEKNLFLNRKKENENKLTYLQEELSELGSKYHSVVDSKFDDSRAVCPTCGRKYDESKSNEIKDKFEKSKKERALSLIDKGNEIKRKIDELKDIVDIEFDDSELVKVNAKLESLYEQKNGMKTTINISENVAYNEINRQIESIENECNELVQNDMTEQIEENLKNLRCSLRTVEIQIAKSDCTQAEARKEELEIELVEVGQKIADCERILYLIDLFVTEKLNRISDSINSKFSMVGFKLFQKQINGGIAECCECTVNGVPFASVNTGHKIVAGLDIIKTLQIITGIKSFIFIDNAEAVNDFNLPEMDNQIICLRVSENKEMRIENND